MNSSLYQNWLQDLNLFDIEKKGNSLIQFKELFLAFNEKTNLASKASCLHFDINHILDSLSLIPAIQKKTQVGSRPVAAKSPMSIMDLGTGGGLPGIPLAICLPEVQFVLVDSIGKKINFVRDAIHALELPNTEVLLARVEDLRNDLKKHHSFDIIISRAFGEMALIIELTFPLLKKDGVYLLPRGSNDESGNPDLEKYLQKAGGEILSRHKTLWEAQLGGRSVFEIAPGEKRIFSRKSFSAIKKESQMRKG
jgi:16S rRNA (guanine527-N7)-methyltransferase